MTKRLGVICVLLILTMSVGYSQEKETVSAQQILDRMLSVYASCKSYVDKGQAKVVFLSGRANRVETKPFTTAFVRPSQFRFEFTENSDPLRQRLVVWRDQTSIKSWWALNRETKYYETLGEPLRNATGVSSTSAAVVPTMLFQNLGDERRLQTLTELSLVGEEKVRGRPAYRVQGKDWANI